MILPQSNCANCFKENPERRFTHRTSVKRGARRYTHKMPVPLCQSCHTRVLIGLVLKTVLIIAGIGLVLYTVVPMVEAEWPTILIVIWLPFAMTLAIVLSTYAVNLGLNIDFVRVVILAGTATVTFMNPDYQQLYEEANKLPH